MSVLDITLRQFIEFAVYALPAVLLWYFLFRFQNKRALPQETVRDTFFIGIFSVIPLFLYQYAYTNWSDKLGTDYLGNILENEGIITTLIQVMLGFAAMGVFFAITIAGFTIFYSLFTKESWKNTLKSLLSEPLNFSATSIIFLFVLVLDIALRTFTPFSIPQGLIGTTFILAILEEYSKHLFVRLFDDHKIKNVASAIELSIVVALSFAFLENIIYFTTTAPGSLRSVIIGRSIISMFGHIIFSAVFGYYYGISKFAKSVMHVESVETHAPAFPQWIYKIFKFKTQNTYKAQKIFEGLVFATLIHTVFNIFLEYNFLVGIVPILIGGGYLVYRMLNSDIAQREFSLVGSKEMPEEDFEKLVWKVSMMKHLQDIKKEHPDVDKEKDAKDKDKTAPATPTKQAASTIKTSKPAAVPTTASEPTAKTPETKSTVKSTAKTPEPKPTPKPTGKAVVKAPEPKVAAKALDKTPKPSGKAVVSAPEPKKPATVKKKAPKKAAKSEKK